MPGKQSESQGKQLGYTYSIEDIERLKKQPGVVDVTPDMIIFDLAFKQELYDEWVESPCVETIRRSFIKRGADVDAFSPKVFFRFNSNFYRAGRPKHRAFQFGEFESCI